ncbi:RING/FYVE/PHD zinc finger superfamily protein, partial [Tanacetum coccineum]
MLLQMEDHLVLRVDQLVTSKSIEAPGLSPDASCSRDIATCISVTDGKEGGEYDEAGEDDPLIQSIECRICQEEDSIKNLEVPCACNGSLKVLFRLLIGIVFNDGAMRKETLFVKSVTSEVIPIYKNKGDVHHEALGESDREKVGRHGCLRTNSLLYFYARTIFNRGNTPYRKPHGKAYGYLRPRYVGSMIHKLGRIDEDKKDDLSVFEAMLVLKSRVCTCGTNVLWDSNVTSKVEGGKNSIRSANNLGAELVVETIVNKLRKGRSTWFGYVTRRPQLGEWKL